MQKLTKKNRKENLSKHKSLSIQFSLDGFSFCIKNSTSNTIEVLTSYSFEKRLESPNSLQEKVQQIFETDKDLQSEFDQILAIHQNQLTTQVPEAYFDEKELKTYLDYNIKTFSSDYITFDTLGSLQAKNIYIPYVNINNFLFQNFGEFEFKHHSTILIEELSKIQKETSTSTPTMYVNVSQKTFDILVFNGETFTLYNSFEYLSTEDFLYYILFTAEQLEMNPVEFQLILMGDITKESETYKLAKEYIKNINFINSTTDFLEDSEEFKPHSNFILLS